MTSSLSSKLRVISSSTRDFYLFNTHHYKFYLVQVILSRLLGPLTQTHLQWPSCISPLKRCTCGCTFVTFSCFPQAYICAPFLHQFKACTCGNLPKKNFPGWNNAWKCPHVHLFIPWASPTQLNNNMLLRHVFYVCFSYIKFSEIVLFCWVWNSDSSLTAVAVKTKLLEMLLLWDVTLPVTVHYNCAPATTGVMWSYYIWFRSTLNVRDSLLLMAVRVYDSLELEVMDPKDNQGDIEQENGES